MRLAAAVVLAAAWLPSAAQAQAPELSEQAINAADFAGWRASGAEAAPAEQDTDAPDAAEDEPAASEAAERQRHPDPFLIRLQILLDRAHVSPGVIDGYPGQNLEKAVRAFEGTRGLPVDGKPDAELWQMLVADAAPAVSVYELTGEDVDGRYVDAIPEDYAEMAELEWLGYRGPAEMLAERFHLDEDLLTAMNPGADVSTAGTRVLVPALGAEPEAEIVRIVVDKSDGELRAYDRNDTIVAAYPATIGSEDNPSPAGEFTVELVVHDPDYTYDPDVNFQNGDNTEALKIAPGPNGPVGNVWIDLSEPTYGIHGTSEPSLIDKAASHGCVRLANWDAAALADMVVPKETRVVFED